MKPRLRIKHGVWCCRSPWPPNLRDIVLTGYGYKPQEAYAEWLERGGIPCPRKEPTKETP